MASTRLCANGHIATAAELTSWGVSLHAIRHGLSDGRIVRLRRGIYACPHAPQLARDSAVAGGAATCISVLREAGVWAGNSRLLHVQVSPHGAAPKADGVRIHWDEPRFPMKSAWMAGPQQALWTAIHCLDEENAAAAMESALAVRFLLPHEIAAIAELAPRRLKRTVTNMVAESGSGNETIVRRRVELAGYRVEAQALVPGMGHVDLLVEDCVALEIDGRAWHGEDRYEIDHERDMRSEGLGRRVLRISTTQIHRSWPTTMAVIERLVREGIRERDRRRGRIVVGVGDAPASPQK